ncbi:NADH:flavin oxidoreductase/NADH oxidase, partial [bacterium]|nr:NADH:flavin oxidoreductase/NADH oxidase [bacterium]
MALFTPLPLRSVTIPNRVGVSPMCQYSAERGLANDWHLVHLGARALGGAGLVMTEATAVSPEGRISPQDLGLWSDEQIPPLARIASFLSAQGSVPAIQLAHAGRKASTRRAWDGGGPAAPADGGWEPVLAPSAVAFDDGWQVPQALDEAGMDRIVGAFASASRRAATAGFQVAEIHAAHGYLLHQFLSPIANSRSDSFGGSLENRMRFPLRVVQAVRSAWPDDLPLFLRISATDWVEGGFVPDEALAFARQARTLGIDLVDCSSGGMHPRAQVPVGPGYQVPFAARIRSEARVATAAVGLITTARQAAAIVESGQADLVLLGREMLRTPHW